MSFLSHLSEQIRNVIPDSIEDKFEKLMHSNDRHDDPQEQAQDALYESLRMQHRFNSFAKERVGNHVKWYIDGHDYFYAVSELLESAKESIFIQDWWLSPELYLRRPPALNEKWRLDRVLKRRAEAGVKVHIIVYKEVELNMTMKSSHTKHTLEALHPNVACMRHPDHFDHEEATLFWSHHQKVVVVDNITACIGGLDLCFGRWDTHCHPLADCHISDFTETVWPGQDYNNARIQDFQNVEQWPSNQQSRLEAARMPWHDVHSMLVGPAVMDVCQHFIERWNFIGKIKYTNKGAKYTPLAFPHVLDLNTKDSIASHPHYSQWNQLGIKYRYHEKLPEKGGHPCFAGVGPKGDMNVQVVRSASDWSNGTLTEHSILSAYIDLIRDAQHFIYIENQFFITTCGDHGHIKNQIGLALAERIIKAASQGRKFKVIVMIPCIPGFAGDLDSPDSAGTLAIMDWTYKSISRGKDSIFQLVRNAGHRPEEFITFYNLRTFDRINSDSETLEKIENDSGVTYYETQAALARIYLGNNASPEELENNKEVTFKMAQKGECLLKEFDLQAKGGKTLSIKLPHTIAQAKEQLRRFSAAAPGYDREVSDSISTKCMEGGLENLPWLGSEESQKLAFVTEELYIHTKMMIVDDRIVIIGSANINDRSMLGDRDSEIAIVIEDTEEIDSWMNGQYYSATKFAGTLRRQLFKEHLGLLSPQRSLLQRNDPTNAMRPTHVPQDDHTGTEEDRIVMDPLSDEFEMFCKNRARTNTASYAKVFRCVPTPGIDTWEKYKDFVSHGQNAPKTGHVASVDMSLSEIQEELNRIRGHIVEMPLDFLEREREVYKEGPTVNTLTMQIFT